jgi:hypothetical protein
MIVVNCFSRFHVRVMPPSNVYEMVVRNVTAGTLGLAPLDILEADL